MSREPVTGSAVAWVIPGQTALFDAHHYYQAHTDWPWLDPSLVSDDQLHQWRHPTLSPDTATEAASAFGAPHLIHEQGTQ